MNTGVALYAAKGIEKRFGGVRALRGVDVEIRPGEVHALIGENGAGKSTLGKVLAGVFPPDAGTLNWQGEGVRFENPLQAQRLGIGMIFQELDLFPNLTVAENIVLGNLHYEERGWVSRRRMDSFCRPFLGKVGLAARPGEYLANLPIGQVQLAAIARALSMKARVMVMDEATSSLTDDAVDNLFRLIGQLRDEGAAIVYVSHKMEEILRVGDRITVLRDGQNAGTRAARETGMDELIRLMVGRELQSRRRSRTHAGAESLLEVEDLCTDRLRQVSFALKRGEVLGLAGLVGAGRSEIGRALFGLDRVHSGTVRLSGRAVRPGTPESMIRNGLGYVPEDRKVQGLMMQMNAMENMSISTLRRFGRCGWLAGAGEEQACGETAWRTRIKVASARQEVNSLSGGNQQKVLLGRWLMVNPELFFLDDPTRGVDVGAKEDIYGIIEDLAAQGKGIIMVSSELPELLRCCDRILVMKEGRLAGEVDAATADQEAIMALAMH